MKYAVFLILAAALGQAQQFPRIVYTKSFPGSTPPYISITLEKTGAAEYRDAPDDPNPLRFQLSAAEVSEIFALADKLDRFKRPLESGLKVANMGMKTFRFEDGKTHTETKFNYSQDLDARALHDWFERITESEHLLIQLERTIRFDRLGLNAAVVDVQAAWERKRLVAPEQFLKLLDRIAKNQTFMHMTRERSASLADAIRAAAQPAAARPE
jgi:hypothetical protein